MWKQQAKVTLAPGCTLPRGLFVAQNESNALLLPQTPKTTSLSLEVLPCPLSRGVPAGLAAADTTRSRVRTQELVNTEVQSARIG